MTEIYETYMKANVKINKNTSIIKAIINAQYKNN